MCVRWHICHAKPCNTMYVQWQCWDTYHVYHGKPCNAMCVWWQWWNTNLATALPNWDLGDSSPSPAPTGGWEQISQTLPVSPKYWRPKIINVNCPRPNVCAIVTCNIVTKGGIWWLGKRKGKRWLVRVVVRCDDVRADVKRCNKFWNLCNIHPPGPLAVTSLTDVYMINVKVFMRTLKSWRGAVLVQMWFHWVR